MILPCCLGGIAAMVFIGGLITPASAQGRTEVPYGPERTLIDVLSATPFVIESGKEFSTGDARLQELRIRITPASLLPATVSIEYVGGGNLAGTFVDAMFTASGQKSRLNQIFKASPPDITGAERLQAPGGQGHATTFKLPNGNVCIYATKGNYSGKDSFGDGSRGYDLLVESLTCGAEGERAALRDYIARAKLTTIEANRAALAARR